MKASEVEKLAAELHQCPHHYDGPCWGPTMADRSRARKILRDRAAAPTESDPT